MATKLQALLRLVQLLGTPDEAAFRCPRCRQEGTLVVRLHSGGLARCVSCTFRSSTGYLLDPDDAPARERETRRVMEARPKRG